MKKFRKYLSVILLMFLTGVMSSCIKDKLPVEADLEKTATVTLRINEPFSSEPLGRSTSPALSDEGIKTLRVIVANANNQVEFNYKHDFSSEANPLIKKTVTFLGMTTGKKKIYVVANEESINPAKRKATPIKNEKRFSEQKRKAMKIIKAILEIVSPLLLH